MAERRQLPLQIRRVELIRRAGQPGLRPSSPLRSPLRTATSSPSSSTPCPGTPLSPNSTRRRVVRPTFTALGTSCALTQQVGPSFGICRRPVERSAAYPTSKALEGPTSVVSDHRRVMAAGRRRRLHAGTRRRGPAFGVGRAARENDYRRRWRAPEWPRGSHRRRAG